MDIFVPTQFHSNVCLQAWQHLKPSVYSEDVIIKRLMLVLKVSNFYLHFFFHMANSLHSTEIKTHSFIARFLFCFVLGVGAFLPDCRALGVLNNA